mgnify:FL=1
MTIILGIDPGSRKTGFGLVETDGAGTRYLSSGVIKLPVDQSLALRLKVLAESLNQIICEYKPTLAVIEQVFMAKSADSALKLGQARGAAMVVCSLAGLDVHEYATRQIKQAVVGTGGASKAQVQHMVTRLLKLPSTPQEDASDALAAALCHISGDGVRRATGAQTFATGRLK